MAGSVIEVRHKCAAACWTKLRARTFLQNLILSFMMHHVSFSEGAATSIFRAHLVTFTIPLPKTDGFVECTTLGIAQWNTDLSLQGLAHLHLFRPSIYLAANGTAAASSIRASRNQSSSPRHLLPIATARHDHMRKLDQLLVEAEAEGHSTIVGR